MPPDSSTQLLDRFERAWRLGNSPELDDFVRFEADRSANGPIHRDLLMALVEVDLKNCWEAGSWKSAPATTHGDLTGLAAKSLREQRPLLEDYVARFPQLGPLRNLPVELILLEYRLRRICGDQPAHDQYALRFDDRAGQLLGKLAQLDHEIEAEVSLLPTSSESKRSSMSTMTSSTSSENADFATTEDADELPSIGSDRPYAGMRFGDYELVAEIGRGGMGVVYRARQMKLNRTVALKMILSGHLATRQDIERFYVEAEAAASLQHPGIVAIHEVGEIDGRHYFSMDYVAGQSLSRLIHTSPLSGRKSAVYLKDISKAIECAHENGVLHRDLKPSNVLIDEFDKPWVTDFGLAKRLEDDSGLTKTGQVLGTPSYMPPEQARGIHSATDRRSDVYALGAILYESLTARPPFRAESAWATIHQVIQEEPVSPRLLNADIDRDLEIICLKCLQKERSQRYQSAADLVDDLERFLDGRPIQARAVSRWERFARWCKRNPVFACLAATIVGVTLSGFVGVTWQWRQTLKTELERTYWQADLVTKVPAPLVPRILDRLKPYDGDVNPWFHQLLTKPDLPPSERNRARLALLSVDPTQGPFLRDAMLLADPQEFLLIRDRLLAWGADASDPMWQILGDEASDVNRRFRAASYLAERSDASRDRWANHARFVVQHMIATAIQNPKDYAAILEMFRDAAAETLEPLKRVFHSNSETENRVWAARFLSEYAQDDLETLLDLVKVAGPQQYSPLFEKVRKHHSDAAKNQLKEFIRSTASLGSSAIEKDRRAQEQAKAAITLLRLGSSADVWPLLRASDDLSTRSYMIDRFRSFGTDPQLLIRRLRVDRDDFVRRAIYMTLGNFPKHEIPPNGRGVLLDELVATYRNDPDPGTHAAVRWLLKQWGLGAAVESMDDELVGPPSNARRWYVNSAGHLMAIYGPATFQMGSPEDELGRLPIEPLHEETIPRRFAIAMHEVTITQFQEMDQEWVAPTTDGSPGESPVYQIFWSQAAAYCNWLSEKEGIPRDQWCYGPEVTPYQYPDVLDSKSDSLSRRGYRLPTEAEWEHACRAGTRTARFFGHGTDLMPQYAWCPENTKHGIKQAVGQKKPNDYGLFDTYGNAVEWCHDYLGKQGNVKLRALRGLAAGDVLPDRSALRDAGPQPNIQIAGAIGFRVARTVDPVLTTPKP